MKVIKSSDLIAPNAIEIALFFKTIVLLKYLIWKYLSKQQYTHILLCRNFCPEISLACPIMR